MNRRDFFRSLAAVAATVAAAPVPVELLPPANVLISGPTGIFRYVLLYSEACDVPVGYYDLADIGHPLGLELHEGETLTVEPASPVFQLA